MNEVNFQKNTKPVRLNSIYLSLEPIFLIGVEFVLPCHVRIKLVVVLPSLLQPLLLLLLHRLLALALPVQKNFGSLPFLPFSFESLDPELVQHGLLFGLLSGRLLLIDVVVLVVAAAARRPPLLSLRVVFLVLLFFSSLFRLFASVAAVVVVIARTFPLLGLLLDLDVVLRRRRRHRQLPDAVTAEILSDAVQRVQEVLQGRGFRTGARDVIGVGGGFSFVRFLSIDRNFLPPEKISKVVDVKSLYDTRLMLENPSLA